MFFKLLKQDIKNLLKQPPVVFTATLYPVLLILMFGYLFSNQYASSQTTSYDYYGVTMLTFIVGNAVTVTPNAFMEEKIKYPNLRISYAPVRDSQVYGAKMLASFLLLAVGMSVGIVLLDYFNIVNFGGQNILYILILVWSFLLFVCMLGAAVCVSLRSEELTNKVLSLLMGLLSLLGGCFFPLSVLGEHIAKLASISPVAWLNRCLFQIIHDNDLTLFWPVVIAFLLASLMLLFVVHKKYRPQDFLSI